MNTIDELNLVTLNASSDSTTCDVIHDVPAVIFSTGGYTGNVHGISLLIYKLTKEKTCAGERFRLLVQHCYPSILLLFHCFHETILEILRSNDCPDIDERSKRISKSLYGFCDRGVVAGAIRRHNHIGLK